MKDVVLITGCSSGIGRATAEVFARAGWETYPTARRPETLADLAAPNVHPLELDVDDAGSREAAVRRVMEEQGRIDVLVNNAGYGRMGPLLCLSPESLRAQLETNTVAPVALAREVLLGPAGMLERRRGRIVNVGSIVAHVPTPFSGPYCASKAALKALSDVFRLELAPFGIPVIQIEPGPIRSRFSVNATEAARETLAALGPYASLVRYVEKRLSSSQRRAAPAAVVARAILRAATARRPPHRITVTGQARLMRALKALLPARTLDAMLAHAFGLDSPLP